MSKIYEFYAAQVKKFEEEKAIVEHVEEVSKKSTVSECLDMARLLIKRAIPEMEGWLRRSKDDVIFQSIKDFIRNEKLHSLCPEVELCLKFTETEVEVITESLEFREANSWKLLEKFSGPNYNAFRTLTGYGISFAIYPKNPRKIKLIFQVMPLVNDRVKEMQKKYEELICEVLYNVYHNATIIRENGEIDFTTELWWGI